MSIERFVAINFGMNLLLVGVCARAVGRVRGRRILLAALLGTAYALLAFMLPSGPLRALPASALCAVAMAAVCVGVRDRGKLLRMIAHLSLCAVFQGGALLLLERWVGGADMRLLWWAPPLVALILVMVLDARAQRLERWHVRLMMDTRWGRLCLEAFVDTGNRLREPLSGLPVIIADADCLRPLLEAGMEPQRNGTLSAGFRLVKYGALGGGGRMACFLPDALYVASRSGWRSAPDTWVALYPGKMPGPFHVLAPLSVGRLCER